MSPMFWILFGVLVLGILAFDLGVLSRKVHVPSTKEALWRTALFVALSLAFAPVVWWLYERGGGTIWAPVIVHAAAHAPKLLAPGTLDTTAELAWIVVVMAVPYLAFALLRRDPEEAAAPAPSDFSSSGTDR